MTEKEYVREILCQQMELMTEASKKCEPKELADLSNSMANLYLAYLQGDFYQ